MPKLRAQECIFEAATDAVAGKRKPDGQIHFYAGELGEERKVRVEFFDGRKKAFFVGPPGEERMVQVTWPDGVQQFYAGPKGHERKVRSEFPHGQRQYFEGNAMEERMVKVEVWQDGQWLEADPEGCVFADAEKKVRACARAAKLAAGDARHIEGLVRDARRRAPPPAVTPAAA